MHVVVHQHVGMQATAGGVQRFPQQLAIAGAIFVVQEAGQAIVAALHDVLRDAGQVEAWESGHARMVATLAKARNAWKGNRRVGVVLMLASEVNLTPFLAGSGWLRRCARYLTGYRQQPMGEHL